jgi:Flp pilus assembly protein TadD
MNPWNLDPLLSPTEQARHLASLCAGFEAGWQAEQRPRLETFLTGVAELDRPALLRRLLTVELAARSRRGETPAPDEYRERLPGCSTLIDEVFALFVPTGPQAPPSPVPITQDQRPTDLGARASSSPETPSSVSPGVRAGRYEIEGEIGRGGMGVVLRARDPELNRPLAVKILAEQHHGSLHMARRFREEAQLTGQLQHPGIPPVHEVGTLPDGRPFFAMKLIRGRTLAELLRDRPTPAHDLPRFLGIFEQVCQTLAYAHSQGVIHRDLKPQNIMVGAFGEVQVMDWGLAKPLASPALQAASRARQAPEDPVEPSGVATARTGAAGELSQEGDVLGTPAYMAPEQARGEIDALDERCDVFGLGAILCVILTGQPPYRGSKVVVQTRAARGELGEAQERLAACGADPQLLELAWVCLAPEKEARPRDAGVVAQGMAAYLAGVQERVRAAERERAAAEARALEEYKRRRLGMALAGVVLLLVLGVGSAAWWYQQQRSAAQARRDEATRRARALLDQARPRLEQAWQACDLARLKEAKGEAERAVEIAQGGAEPEVRQEAAAFRKTAGERLARAEKTRVLLDGLLNVSAPRETARYLSDGKGLMTALVEPTVDAQYSAHFRRWGLDFKRTPERELVLRLRGEPEPALQEILAALDNWALALKDKGPATAWRRLLRLAGELDRSALRRQLRALLLRETPPPAESVAGLLGPYPAWPALAELTRGTTWRQLRELGRKMNVKQEPVLSVVLLARVGVERGDEAGAEKVLRRAVNVRQSDVVLLTALGWLLERHRPPRLEEAIGCYRAVCAVRPGLGVKLANALVRVGRASEGETVLRELVTQQPRNPELHFHLGNALGEQGKLAGAVAAFKKAIRLDPRFVRAHTNLGVALERQGKLAESVAAHRAALGIDPSSADGYTNLGIALQKLQRRAEAATAFRTALFFKSDLPEAHLGLGLMLAIQGKQPEAIAAYREAIRLNPELPLAHMGLGVALRDQGKPAEAAAAYREAIRLKPDFAEAHNDLGITLYDLGKLVEALAAYREALRLKPTYSAAHNNLGNALAKRGKLVEAVAAYREAIRLEPDFSRAHYNLGLALARQGKPAEAVAAYREGIRLEPNDPQAHIDLGLALGRQGKQAEAMAAYREALHLNPDSPLTYNNVGTLLYEQGNLVEAITAYRKAIRLKPDYPQAYFNLGIALELQGKLAEAASAYQQAVRLKPDLPQAHNNLGNVLKDLSRLPEAEDAYRQAIRHKPDFSQPHYNLGVLLRRLGKLAEAADALRRATRLKPDDHEAHSALGIVLTEQGKPDEGEAAHRKALRLKPDFVEAHVALGVDLFAQGKRTEAASALREALRRDPDDLTALLNLGVVLSQLGKFHEALAPLRRAHALSVRQAGPAAARAAALIRELEHVLELDRALPEFLSGKRETSSAAELLMLATLCRHEGKRLYAVSARFYADAFAARPTLADDLGAGYRYNAAWSAAQAGCGRGEGAGKLSPEKRSELRKQALDWFRADLRAWTKQVETGKPQTLATARWVFAYWQKDAGLAGIRDPDELKRLPEGEQAAWRQLWSDVVALLKRAERK